MIEANKRRVSGGRETRDRLARRRRFLIKKIKATHKTKQNK